VTPALQHRKVGVQQRSTTHPPTVRHTGKLAEGQHCCSSNPCQPGIGPSLVLTWHPWWWGPHARWVPIPWRGWTHAWMGWPHARVRVAHTRWWAHARGPKHAWWWGTRWETPGHSNTHTQAGQQHMTSRKISMHDQRGVIATKGVVHQQQLPQPATVHVSALNTQHSITSSHSTASTSLSCRGTPQSPQLTAAHPSITLLETSSLPHHPHKTQQLLLPPPPQPSLPSTNHPSSLKLTASCP